MAAMSYMQSERDSLNGTVHITLPTGSLVDFRRDEGDSIFLLKFSLPCNVSSCVFLGAWSKVGSLITEAILSSEKEMERERKKRV